MLKKFIKSNRNLISVFVVASTIIMSFTSCNLEGESNYTPSMTLIAPPKLQNGDSLKLYLTAINDEYLMDTIQVGDTVSFALLLNGFTNNLMAFYMVQSADSVSRVILAEKSSLDSVFLSTSNYSKGNFYCKSEIPALVFPFKYIATASSKECKIGFTVTSDAKFENGFGGSNASSFKIKTPIKNRVVQ